MKEFKFKTTFTSSVRPLVSEEKDKHLALASLVDVGNFLPQVDVEKNVDLLPIAFNAFVVNRVNKNGDVIDTETALAMYESFKNKPINIEHNRDKVLGTILTAGFSKFGSDEPMTEEEAKSTTAPFNVTLGGVVWRIVNEQIANIIENSSDPTSEDFMKISASWELGFEDYNIVVMENEEDKNMENALEVISAEEDVDKFSKYLRAEGGKGEIKERGFVYRQVIANVVPLGIGLTENPAADVKGVATNRTLEEESLLDLASKVTVEERAESEEENEPIEASESKENFSQKENNVVNKNTQEGIIMMKLTNINDITDESLKTVSASAVTDFIQEELKRASEDFSEERNKLDTELAAAKEELDTVSSASKELKEEMDKIKAALEQLEKEKSERIKEEKFNQRMAFMDDTYNLSDEDRKVVASQIGDLDDEAFEAYQGEMSILLSSRNKEEIEKQAKETEAAEEAKLQETNEETKASEETQADVAEEVVEQVVEQAKEEPETVPVSATASDPSDTVYDKYRKAFDIDNFEIKL